VVELSPVSAAGGRKKGQRNKLTQKNEATISELAKAHAPMALQALADIAAGSESDAARVSAANSLLDRAYGKAPQPLTGSEDGPPIVQIIRFSGVSHAGNGHAPE
jgi:hypothetical protein